jgi:G3E family GTPase
VKLPVTVLGGYLGVGKTTLLNHLLRQAGGRRLAVLVNDFGDINIDAGLIESREGNVLELAGGCVCCSFGSDLVGALLALPQRKPAPDHVVIETSGVALPGSVARTVGLVSELTLDAVIVVVDADTVRERAADRYVGDTVSAQLAQADLVVVNTLDLVDADTLADLGRWLQIRAEDAPIVHAEHGVVPLALILGGALSNQDALHDSARNERGRAPDSPLRPLASGRLFPAQLDAGPNPDGLDGLDGPGGPDGANSRGSPGAPEGLAGSTRLRSVVDSAALRFESISIEVSGAIDLERLARELTDPTLGVLRAKGLMCDREGRSKSLQLVGTRTALSNSRHADPTRNRLVCIGLRGRLDREAIAARLEGSRVRHP